MIERWCKRLFCFCFLFCLCMHSHISIEFGFNTNSRINHRCWCVRMCSTRLCLCLDFLRQIGHSNLGSTPHSNRMCRFKLCGRAYEFPHCLHIKMLWFDADVAIAAAVFGGLRGDVRSVCVDSRSVLRSKRFGGDLVVITGSDNSFKHVAGVSKRKSHGWSYPITVNRNRTKEKKKNKKKKQSRITFEK